MRGRHIHPGLFVIPRYACPATGAPHEDYVEVAATTSHKPLNDLKKREQGHAEARRSAAHGRRDAEAEAARKAEEGQSEDAGVWLGEHTVMVIISLPTPLEVS